MALTMRVIIKMVYDDIGKHALSLQNDRKLSFFYVLCMSPEVPLLIFKTLNVFPLVK